MLGRDRACTPVGLVVVADKSALAVLGYLDDRGGVEYGRSAERGCVVGLAELLEKATLTLGKVRRRHLPVMAGCERRRED